MLSVIIPVFNEEKTIEAIITKVHNLPTEKEIIVVNDCSKDKTAVILSSISLNNLKVIHHASNRGKAAAVRTGIENATGEFFIIQDADSGCDFNNYLKLLEVAKNREVDIVLGVRVGNCFISFLLNILFGVKLNGWFTCYRLMRRESLLNLPLELKSSDIAFEILTKAIRKKMRIIEVPILNDPAKN